MRRRWKMKRMHGQAWTWTKPEQFREAYPRTWRAKRKLKLTQRRSRTELREEGVEVDEDGDVAEELRQNVPHEKGRPTEKVTERKWGLPHGCSEPRPQPAEIRIADE